MKFLGMTMKTTYEYEIEHQHYKTFLPISNSNYMRTLPLWLKLIVPIGLALAFVGLFLYVGQFSNKSSAQIVLINLYIGATAIFIPYQIPCLFGTFGIYNKHYADQMLTGNRTAQGLNTLTLTEDSCTLSNYLCSTTYKWPTFLKLTQSKNTLLLWVSPLSAAIIPLRAFQNEKEKQQFIEYIENKIQPVPANK